MSLTPLFQHALETPSLILTPSLTFPTPSLTLIHPRFYSEPVTIYCVALHWLYQINRDRKYSIVPVTLFNNAAVSSLSSNMLVKVTPLRQTHIYTPGTN